VCYIRTIHIQLKTWHGITRVCLFWAGQRRFQSGFIFTQFSKRGSVKEKKEEKKSYIANGGGNENQIRKMQSKECRAVYVVCLRIGELFGRLVDGEWRGIRAKKGLWFVRKRCTWTRFFLVCRLCSDWKRQGLEIGFERILMQFTDRQDRGWALGKDS
jgi:hypothetical protein